MDRRSFIAWIGLGTLVDRLLVAITATAAPKPRTDGFIAVGTLKDLQKNGIIQAPKFAAGPLLVIPNPKDPKKLIALNAKCPHRGCPVNWQSKTQQFSCPCHSSLFNANGSVVRGPAQKPLAAFAVKVEGGSVLVKAA